VAFKKAGIRFDAKGNGLNKNYFKSDGKNYYSIYSSQSNQEVKRVQVNGFELYHLTDPQLTATGKLFFTGTPNKLKKKDQVIFPGIFYGNYDAASGTVSGVKAFPVNQTDAYGVLSPWLDEEQKRLYFSSSRPGGLGGYDLYYVTWDEAMNFSEPISLGEAVNSTSNERDGHRFGEEFYFSSDRTGGSGGLDVYVSTLQAGQFTKGVNLGLPVNSAADDFGFVKIANNEAYLSSDRAEGTGSDDLYALTWENKTLKILIANEAGNQINSGTALQLKRNGETIDISGKSETEILTLLENDKAYTLVANRPGYFPQELTFSYTEEVEELVVNMVPIPYNLEVYKAIIYYAFDKDLLRDLSKEKLDELAALLAKHPELNLVIESHTDSWASDSYNEQLSERRAKSVIHYLEAKGINSNRVSASWFSEEKLVNDCGDGIPCPAADHQLNRRTELKLVAYADQNKAYSAPVGASPADFVSRESMVLWFLKK
jgi:outer membrane protein OmpA-like peptidoglycan-associated protein